MQCLAQCLGLPDDGSRDDTRWVLAGRSPAHLQSPHREVRKSMKDFPASIKKKVRREKGEKKRKIVDSKVQN